MPKKVLVKEVILLYSLHYSLFVSMELISHVYFQVQRLQLALGEQSKMAKLSQQQCERLKNVYLFPPLKKGSISTA